MRLLATSIFILILAGTLRAQDIWFSDDSTTSILGYSAAGILETSFTVPATDTLDDVYQAPDGKIWITYSFPAVPTFSIVDPDGSNFTNITMTTTGSAFAVAFDQAGHGWVTADDTVVEYDASGVELNKFLLPNANGLGITIDADGNKWIAHRNGPPGTLSRIDGTTGAITSHAMPSTSQILPIWPVADFRGILTSSHIWVTGDNRGAGELIELDSQGNVLNVYNLDPSGRFGRPAVDATGDVWVSDWSSGLIRRVDATNGSVLATHQPPASLFGLHIGPYGNPWGIERGGAGLQRIGTGTEVTEVRATPGASGRAGLATTRTQFAYVVDQLGDLDGDGDPNFFEVQTGRSPFDASSDSFTSLTVTGVARPGNAVNVGVDAGPSTVTFYVFGTGPLQSPGLTHPAIQGSFLLDTTMLLSVSDFIVGPGMKAVPIPNDPSLVGLEVRTQGATFSSTAARFTNPHGMVIW